MAACHLDDGARWPGGVWMMLAMLLLHTPAHVDTLARYAETQLTRQHLPGLALMVLKNRRCHCNWLSGKKETPRPDFATA